MNIEPYISVDGISFDYSKDKVVTLLGEPTRIKTNRLKLEEYDYQSQVFRFNQQSQMQEVTIHAEKLKISGECFEFGELENLLKQRDVETFDCYGFLVSPKFGIAFDPTHNPWVTVFSEEGLVQWKKI